MSTAPASLLGLPKELRQKILFHFYSDKALREIANEYATRHHLFTPSESELPIITLTLTKQRIGDVHPTLAEDMAYVHEKWLAKIQVMVDERLDEWAENIRLQRLWGVVRARHPNPVCT